MKELYLNICHKLFGRTITEMVRKEQSDNPWLFIFLALIAGVTLAWTKDKKTVIAVLISLFVGLLIGHFFFGG